MPRDYKEIYEEEASFYTAKEEVANIWTHLIGGLLSLFGLYVLIQKGLASSTPLLLVANVIFGLSLVIALFSSVLYHWSKTPTARHWLRVFDHLSIYLLIAGSYTPFTLINLRNDSGFYAFALIWSLALIGSIFKVLIHNRMQEFVRLDACIYILIGFTAFFFINPIINNVDSGGIQLLLLGGASYLLGVVFYLMSNLPYNHAIWHLFVLGGAGSHFLAILWYVN